MSDGARESVMVVYSDLPTDVQKHLLELESFIGDCDGQWTALQTSDSNVVLDNGTIDASDAVAAFNGIVAALRATTPAAPADCSCPVDGCSPCPACLAAARTPKWSQTNRRDVPTDSAPTDVSNLANEIEACLDSGRSPDLSMGDWLSVVEGLRAGGESEAVRWVKDLLGLYFAPWGAGKAVRFEKMTGDAPFDGEAVLKLIRDRLATPAQSNGTAPDIDAAVKRVMQIRNGMTLDPEAKAIVRRELLAAARASGDKSTVAAMFAETYRSGAQGAEMDCDEAQSLASSIDGLRDQLAEHQSNQRSYEQIIGEKSYQEVAGEISELNERLAKATAALEKIDSWRDDTLGSRPKKNDDVPELTAAFDRGTRMAFIRCSDRARAALKDTQS